MTETTSMQSHAPSRPSRPAIAARERVIVALDVPDLAELDRLLDRLEGQPAFYKIGLELFIAEGERAVEAVRRRGGRLFLDLKLHDIPETVARAVTSAARIHADFLTVHTSGGYEMMRRASEAADGKIQLLGVTVLTSLLEEDLRADGIELTVSEMVHVRARVAARAGVSGLGCSPHEIEAALDVAPNLVLVVPGIRPSTGDGAANGDQRRVGTPAEAFRRGADYIVVGRPIRDAREPAAAFAALVRDAEAHT